MNDPNLDSMNALERLRYLAKLAADSGKAAAAIATARAEMSAAVLQAGARLFELRDGELAWIGRPMENVLTDGGSEEDDDDARDSWLVSIEADLLARVRAQDFDLDELIDQHREDLDDTECLCVTTPAKLPDGEWFAIMTAVDYATAAERTFAFSMRR